MTPTPTAQTTRPIQLTETEKAAIAHDARAKMAELTRILDSIGASPKQSGKRRIAPDGGPDSDAHLVLTTQLLATVTVKMLEHNNEIGIIEKTRFDPAKHELLTPANVRRKRLQLETEKSNAAQDDDDDNDVDMPPLKLGIETRAELAVKTTELLRAMPEVGFMQKVPDKKEQLVDAILKVRRRLQGLG